MLTTLLQFLFDGDDGGGSGDPPAPTDPPQNLPKNDADSEVEKAYAKLREAEKRADAADAKIKRMEREGLSELDSVKAERDDLQTQVAGLTTRLNEAENDKVIDKVAKSLEFRNETVARALAKEKVDPEDRGDEAKVRKALAAIAEADPTLVGKTPPPPSGGPIEPGGPSGEGGSAGFTQQIRESAGRKAAA